MATPKININMKDQYDFSRGKRGAIDPIPEGKTKIAFTKCSEANRS